MPDAAEGIAMTTSPKFEWIDLIATLAQCMRHYGVPCRALV